MSKNKFPRGVICHEYRESISFVWKSLHRQLNNQETIAKFQYRLSEYVDQDYTVSFPFARTGLFAILQSLNLPKKSKILMPPITIKAMLDVIEFFELEPVYIDYERDSFDFDLNILERIDLNEIKVSLYTPLYGIFGDVEKLQTILKNNKIFSIIDFSHQLNSTFKNKILTRYFDCSIYSSSSIKTLDTLGGGHVCTNDKDLFNNLIKFQKGLNRPVRSFLVKKSLINLVRNLLTSRFVFSNFTYYLIKILTRFKPQSTIRLIGNRPLNKEKFLPKIWFTSFTSVQAEIGLIQIEKVKSNDDCRIRNAEYLKSLIPDAKFLRVLKQSKCVFWQLVLKIQEPYNFQKYCLSNGIDIAQSSLLLISALDEYKGNAYLKNAAEQYDMSCIVPCNHTMTREDIEYLSQIILKYKDK